MNIAIAGYALQGKSSYDYWNIPGNSVTVCDQNAELELPSGCKSKLGEGYLENLEQFDLIVRTPKLHPYEIEKANPDAPNILQKVTTNTNEFFKVCPTKNIIGVTGTKGKGTTSTLIAELLRAKGLSVHLGGNIGVPPLELLKNNIGLDDWVVLELANFQLIDCAYSPKIAVALMIGDEHLDWHADMAEYVAAKSVITKFQKPTDTVVYFYDDPISKKIAGLSPGVKIAYCAKRGAYIENDTIVIDGTPICRTNEVGLIGKHNLENICAALSVAWGIYQDTTIMKQIICDFAGLPYRIELRRNIKDIALYNDSFASNPNATIAAIRSVKQPIILIVGGKDRGINLMPFITELQQSDHIKQLFLIGEAAQRIADELTANGIVHFTRLSTDSMQEIVQEAFSACVAGDALLLSPGFPSFDMFTDFEDRGRQFNSAVNNIRPYETFIFSSYDFNEKTRTLQMHYSLDDAIHFNETFVFKVDELAVESPAVRRRAFELLFLMAGVSYYKTYLPRNIEIRGVEVDANLASFLSKTYQKGLGEFFYVNSIDLRTEVRFPVTSKLKAIPSLYNDGQLVGIGGGKDSLLTLELLRELKPTTWACNHTQKLAPLVKKLGTDHISVERTWDPQLNENNAIGALNGHIPISAILACAGIVLAVLSGKKDVIVSNESSANAPTLTHDGIEINHQYSKTLEFEQDFQKILTHLFVDSKRYYSMLRPYTELTIAEKFALYFDKYSSVFCSCNKAFTMKSQTMTWCGNCPKCAFTYLIFAPFIQTEKLGKLFADKNLLLANNLRPTFEQLLGISGVKPLECVGEVEECNIALAMSQKDGVPTLDYTVKFPSNYDYAAQRDHAIPDDVYGILLTAQPNRR